MDDCYFAQMDVEAIATFAEVRSAGRLALRTLRERECPMVYITESRAVNIDGDAVVFAVRSTTKDKWFYAVGVYNRKSEEKRTVYLPVLDPDAYFTMLYDNRPAKAPEE